MKDRGSILVIDDEQAICVAFQRFFQSRGWTVHLAPGVTRGRTLFRERRPDVVFLDVRLPDGNGLDLLTAFLDEAPDACVIVITAYGSLEVVTRAVRGRAFDVLVKPLDLDHAAELLERAWQRRAAVPRTEANRTDDAPGAGGIVGSSPAMQTLYKQIACLALADSTVLVTGETGTGKELVVRALHEHSTRRDQPFVAVNCGALPENLVESELFGHVRGAFTGAHADRAGRFECANHGTLFLDEIGDLPLPAQVKLLRVLDTGIVERIGATESIQLDVRVIAATNRDLEQETLTGRFRADLFYRLAASRIALPRLAEHAQDIPPLVDHFLRQRKPADRPSPMLSPTAAELLQHYSWPGNVRELKHVVEHGAALATGGLILPEHLPAFLRQATVAATGDVAFREQVRRYLEDHGRQHQNLHRDIVETAEAEAIRFALANARGNQTEAAARLGIHRNTLRYRLQALQLDNPGAVSPGRNTEN
jgi:two-component system nitrogen regulation response regulator GlnG